MVNFIDKPVVTEVDYIDIAKLFLNVPLISKPRYLGGVPNVTFRADTSSSRIAIRVCNMGYTTPDHIQLELETLNELKKASYPLSPRLVSGLNGSYLQTWNNYPVIATEFIDGVNASEAQITSELCETLGQGLGSLVSALRNIHLTVPPSEEFWPRIYRLLDAAPDVLYRNDLAVSKQILTYQLDRARFILGKGCLANNQLIHTDVWPPNVITSGSKIAGILDFDDMSFGPAVIDFSAALAEFAIDENCRVIPSRFESFFRGYRRSDTLTAITSDLVTASIEACYAGWLTCNLLHEVPSDESAIYASRLAILGEEQNRKRLLSDLAFVLYN